MKVLVQREDHPYYHEGFGNPAGTMLRTAPSYSHAHERSDEIELDHPVYLELRFAKSEALRSSVVLWWDVLGFYSDNGPEHVLLFNRPVTRVPIRYAEFEKVLVQTQIHNGYFQGWFTLDQKGPSVSLSMHSQGVSE